MTRVYGGAVALALVASAATPAVSSAEDTPVNWTYELQKFEQTYGKNAQDPETFETMNLCVKPNPAIQVADPETYQQQQTGYAACSKKMAELDARARNVGVWSPDLDKMLTTFAESYKWNEAMTVRAELRTAFMADYAPVSVRWSEDMEKTLQPLVQLGDADAIALLDQRRKAELAYWKGIKTWSPELDRGLTLLAGYYNPAGATVAARTSARNAVLDAYRSQAWSVAMESALKPMVDLHIPEAIKLIADKRQALFDQWVGKPYSAEMEQALAPLARVWAEADKWLQTARTFGQAPDTAPSADGPTTSETGGNDGADSAATPPPPSGGTRPDTTTEEPPAEPQTADETIAAYENEFWSPGMNATLEQLASEGNTRAQTLLDKKIGELVAVIVVPIVVLLLGAVAFYLAWFGV